MEEIYDIVEPPKEEQEKVISWLESFGVSSIKSHRDSLEIDTTCAVVEKLFSTQMFVFTSEEAMKRVHFAAMGEYSVPSELSIEMVVGISDFPMPKEARAGSKGASAGVDTFVIPSTYQRIMGIPSGIKCTNPNTTQQPVEFSGYPAFSFSDLQKYAQMTNSTFTNVTRITGPFSGVFLESTLDIQLVSFEIESFFISIMSSITKNQMTTIAPNAVNGYMTATGWMYEYSQVVLADPSPMLVQSVCETHNSKFSKSIQIAFLWMA